MALAGLGAVAIWHDILASGHVNFYAWHGNEHMLERVTIPGFLRGRRYVSIKGAPLCDTLLSNNAFTQAMLQRAALGLYRLQATVSAGARG